MGELRRGTTPTLRFETSEDLTSCDRIILTLKGERGTVQVETPRLEVDAEGITAYLTQADTLVLGDPVEVQVRARAGGVAVASDILTIGFKRILRGGEV